MHRHNSAFKFRVSSLLWLRLSDGRRSFAVVLNRHETLGFSAAQQLCTNGTS
jgi:hypothetical protein